MASHAENELKPRGTVDKDVDEESLASIDQLPYRNRVQLIAAADIIFTTIPAAAVFALVLGLFFGITGAAVNDATEEIVGDFGVLLLALFILPILLVLGIAPISLMRSTFVSCPPNHALNHTRFYRLICALYIVLALASIWHGFTIGSKSKICVAVICILVRAVFLHIVRRYGLELEVITAETPDV